MSLTSLSAGAPSSGFPRVSGDEPFTGIYAPERYGFSPRERG